VRKYLFITNIPTPYRNEFYNSLRVAGLDFEVYYQRRTEADRNWIPEEFKTSYDFYIDKGIYRQFGYFHFHFNPRLLVKICSHSATDFVIGLNWNDVDLLILIILKRLGFIKPRFHFWSEANYQTIGAKRDGIVKKLVRRFVFDCADGSHILSGRMTKITLDRWGVREARYIDLPNTIQDEIFSSETTPSRRLPGRARTTFIMPIRLTEQIKGFMNFFEAIGVDALRGVDFIVAGNGPDRHLLERFVENNDLSANIRIVGHVNAAELKVLYGAADVFVLPSFSDPAPLSIFEAMAMGLPLLVSDRCGNHFEAVIDGQNGYLFDPDSHDSIRAAFNRVLASRDRLLTMGSDSRKMFLEKFRASFVTNRLVSQLLALEEGR
jgi:glycosyltransferase involved in cell wall biosynthesis